MTVPPEYGDEELLRQREGEFRHAEAHEGVAEREIQEHAREELEVDDLDPESNEAHAAGQVCERCGEVITATQDARLLPDGHWQHEVCPRDYGKPSAGTSQP
jgi:formylmethanofuran dehydrogenase subunit E